MSLHCLIAIPILFFCLHYSLSLYFFYGFHWIYFIRIYSSTTLGTSLYLSFSLRCFTSTDLVTLNSWSCYSPFCNFDLSFYLSLSFTMWTSLSLFLLQMDISFLSLCLSFTSGPLHSHSYFHSDLSAQCRAILFEDKKNLFNA
jgi:hypothetical protein